MDFIKQFIIPNFPTMQSFQNQPVLAFLKGLGLVLLGIVVVVFVFSFRFILLVLKVFSLILIGGALMDLGGNEGKEKN